MTAVTTPGSMRFPAWSHTASPRRKLGFGKAVTLAGGAAPARGGGCQVEHEGCRRHGQASGAANADILAMDVSRPLVRGAVIARSLPHATFCNSSQDSDRPVLASRRLASATASVPRRAISA